MRLYDFARPSLGGSAFLPDPGGVNDQAAWLMDAFAVIANAESQLSKGNPQ